MSEGRRIEIRGTVQGVGFRPWVYRLASEFGIKGSIRNDAVGVTIEAFGPPRRLEAFCRRLRSEAPAAAVVRRVRVETIPAEPVSRFEIVATRRRREPQVSIPPDRATCARCLAEVVDPLDRRHRYPFTNCTDCGPRFTIALRTPYDRDTTTMRSFAMCARCAHEYENPGDRRFHAEPNACPECGPRLSLRSASGERLEGQDPVAVAGELLRGGRIVAVKGLGGFHLACDATSSEAVKRLRERKRREEKPFAVMVADRAAAHRVAHLEPEEERLLGAVERPVVLVRPRLEASEESPCAEVAPNLPLLGLMLPYTPLHALLLAAAGRPLVMTSGNLSDEPIAVRNEEAIARLGDVADAFLTHDREVASRCDDSVARVISARPVLLRRSRGYVPKPVSVRRPFRRPVLACGAHLKNTVCIGVGEQAFLGPHVGDLETYEAYAAFQESVDRMLRFVGVEPEVIAYDLHPDYLSSRYAQERPEAYKVGVQHHHAHVVSALAEQGWEGPALGLAWDGSGYGLDGSSWGGELLLAEAHGFERLATFRPLRLAGGDRAVREVWRLALALLDDAFAGDVPIEALSVFERVTPDRVGDVRRMLSTGVSTFPAHGIGRYFDALGALVLGRSESRYEGQIALAWNLLADPAEPHAYPFHLDLDPSPWQVDLRPLTRSVMDDLLHGVPAAKISARFHNALVAIAELLVRRAARQVGPLPVVLTGGCFQNRTLCEGIAKRLGRDFRVALHGEVPPGDGGLALGQAVVANALVETGSDPSCA